MSVSQFCGNDLVGKREKSSLLREYKLFVTLVQTVNQTRSPGFMTHLKYLIILTGQIGLGGVGGGGSQPP